MRKYIAEILLSLDGDHLKTTENWIHEAITADQKNGLKFYLGRDYVLAAEIYQRKGDPAKAKVNMNKAIKIFKECGADGWVGGKVRKRTSEARECIAQRIKTFE